MTYSLDFGMICNAAYAHFAFCLRFVSKLFCLNFSTWDKSKEWTIDMPKGENINCIAIGKGWIVASTSLNRLRVFSVGGIQKFAYDLPNQVVTMSGHEDLLFLVSQCGVGNANIPALI